MKRDLRRKPNIENSDSMCAADLALPSNGEFSNYKIIAASSVSNP